jgi:hypothetical protein
MDDLTIPHNSAMRWFVGLAIVSWLIYAASAPHDLTQLHGGVDGAELALAAAYGGVAHPPGYALFTVLGGIWLHTPFASADAAIIDLYRLNHLLAALTVLLLSLFVYRTRLLHHAHATHNQRLLMALSSGVALALSYGFWSQAVIYEVYTLTVLFFVVLLHLSEGYSRRVQWFSGFVCALAITHHLTALLWLPALLLLWWGKRGWLARLFGLGMGLALGYGLLLLLAQHASAASPYSNWGDIDASPGALLAHISGTQYGGFLMSPTPADLLHHLQTWLAHTIRDFTPLGVGFALWGSVYSMRYARRLLLLLLALWFPLWIFTAFYTAVDTDVTYWLPVNSVLAICVGLGVWRLAMLSPEIIRLALVGLLAGVLMLVHWPSISADDDTMRTTIEQVNALAPADSIILTSSDAASFALAYAQGLEAWRTDLVLLDMRLLAAGWYGRHFAARHPELPALTPALDAWLTHPHNSQHAILSDQRIAPRTADALRLYDGWLLLRPQVRAAE